MSNGPLARSRLFSTLSAEDREALESACDVRQWFDSQALAVQGEPAGELIVVIQGRGRAT